jgi:hypothetical protein
MRRNLSPRTLSTQRRVGRSPITHSARSNIPLCILLDLCISLDHKCTTPASSAHQAGF